MDFEDWEKDRTMLNNEIIVPAYRKFCKENGLTFHFWDELPKEQFNPDVAMEEHELHKEAMNCFNNLKPKFVLFNNKIYTFHFTDWGREFEFQSWDVEDFLIQSHELVNKVDGLQKQLYSAINIIELISALSLTILIGFLIYIFKAPVELLVLIIIIPIALYFFLRKKVFSNPLRKYENEISKFRIRLENLKKQFKSSSDNSENEVELIERAKELVDTARTFVEIMRPQFLKKNPELYVSCDLEKFNIYSTIAFTSIVCTHLHYEVKPELRSTIEEVVQEKLNEFFPTALTDYYNLNNYIKENILKQTEKSKRLFYLHILSAIWILKKIGYVEDFSNPSSQVIEIAEDIAKLFQNETRGYWKMNN